ncbi:MAG: peptide ABC transporter substrate-binding protein [Pseudomonadota bacterium]
MKMLRNLLIAALVAVALLMFFRSGGDETESSLPTLNRGLTSDAESLDPQKSRSTQAATIIRDLGEGLISHTPTGELTGGSAESWAISDDGLDYTFTLRDNLRWSNGDPVLAQHFVAGMQRLVDPATGGIYANAIDAVRNAADIVAGEKPTSSLGVEAPDEKTVVIRLIRPTGYFLGLLTHPSTFPLHPNNAAAYGAAASNPENIAWNGAYRLESWRPGASIRLLRNEQFWDNDNTAIDVVVYHVHEDELTEFNRYRAGELHITDSIPADSFEQARADYPNQVKISQYLGTYYYGYNLTKPPFSDNPNLRAALSIAIDRVGLVEKVTGRGEVPAYSWVPPGVNNYQPPVPAYASLSDAERIAMAQRLYREAGYSEENPLEVELLYNTSDIQERIALAIIGMWSDVLGVQATAVNQEFRVMLSSIREAETTEVFRLSWIGDYDDAHTFLNILQSGNPSNMMQYANSEFDDLMRRAAEQADPLARRLYMEEAELVMLRDHPIVPIYFYIGDHLVSDDVLGWADNVLDYHYSRHLALKPNAE